MSILNSRAMGTHHPLIHTRLNNRYPCTRCGMIIISYVGIQLCMYLFPSGTTISWKGPGGVNRRHLVLQRNGSLVLQDLFVATEEISVATQEVMHHWRSLVMPVGPALRR